MIERPASRNDLRAVVELFVAYDLALRGGVDTDDTDFTDDWDRPGFDWASATLVLRTTAGWSASPPWWTSTPTP